MGLGLGGGVRATESRHHVAPLVSPPSCSVGCDILSGLLSQAWEKFTAGSSSNVVLGACIAAVAGFFVGVGVHVLRASI